ncbi:MAG: protein of unknown function DUF1232, partial [uncultured Rubrobacteraceae bacterium]
AVVDLRRGRGRGEPGGVEAVGRAAEVRDLRSIPGLRRSADALVCQAVRRSGGRLRLQPHRLDPRRHTGPWLPGRPTPGPPGRGTRGADDPRGRALREPAEGAGDDREGRETREPGGGGRHRSPLVGPGGARRLHRGANGPGL